MNGKLFLVYIICNSISREASFQLLDDFFQSEILSFLNQFTYLFAVEKSGKNGKNIKLNFFENQNLIKIGKYMTDVAPEVKSVEFIVFKNDIIGLSWKAEFELSFIVCEITNQKEWVLSIKKIEKLKMDHYNCIQSKLVLPFNSNRHSNVITLPIFKTTADFLCHYAHYGQENVDHRMSLCKEFYSLYLYLEFNDNR